MYEGYIIHGDTLFTVTPVGTGAAGTATPFRRSGSRSPGQPVPVTVPGLRKGIGNGQKFYRRES